MNAAATGSRQQPFSPLVAQFQFHTSDEQEDPRTPEHSQSHSGCHENNAARQIRFLYMSNLKLVWLRIIVKERVLI